MEQLESIRNYWNMRAEGYSAHNMEELEDQNRIRWINAIMRYAPEGERLRVLDIGCGPGFFSILMAQCGHEVVAVDYSDEMIAHAEYNAATMHQSIEFHRMDAQNLEFASESFDLIVSRNVMWCLEHPEKAYREWLRVLRPGGRIVNFDGNFYLDRFDPAYKEAVQDLEAESKRVHGRFVGNVDTEIINRIALDLPLSKVKRPGWDFETLSTLGAHKFDVELFDHLLVEKPEGDQFYCRSFVVSALK
jgi:ubiquinone/menaquinone biosynthesis C-methylase UbiE